MIRKALNIKTARILTLMLISVTEKGGTGSKAVVPGYFVAGKTGTAQKVDPENKSYKKGEYITSFAGFIPAHKPKFVIYIAIDGATKNFYASSLTAPLFSRIASYSVRKAGLSPTVLKEGNVVADTGPTVKKTPAVLKESNIMAEGLISRDQNTIQRQSPPVKRQLAWTTGRVPDLTGLTLREALNKIHKKGFKLKIQGSGRLVRSLPSAGEPLPENKQLTLIFN